MNEFKRCMNVFTHSPFKVRLMLLNMLCDMFNNKPPHQTTNLPTKRRCGTPLHFSVTNPLYTAFSRPIPDLFYGFAIPFAKHLLSNCCYYLALALSSCSPAQFAAR